MMFVLLVLALVAAFVGAQSNSTLIPAGISSSCSAFLEELNSDATLSSCVQPLINATASFSPTAGANSSTADIDASLTSLCGSSTGCSPTYIRGLLSSFYSACTPELTSAATYNAQVRELYDIFYAFVPLQSAVCSIDSSDQSYCVKNIVSAANPTTNASSSAAASASASASAPPSGVANSTNLVALLKASSPVKFAAENLYVVIDLASSATKRALRLFDARDPAQSVHMATMIAPNTTTFGVTNLAFLFLQPTMPSSTLCVPCTRAVMVSYLQWETTMPYALGLSASPILGGQSTLWSGISSTCGENFISAINAEVGVLATSSNGNGTAASAGTRGRTVVPWLAGMAVVAGAMAFLA